MSNHILIVEDDPDGQALVSHIIDHLSIDHDVVPDAEQATSILTQNGNAYQAVIIDLQLPGKDGWELLKEIRGSSKTADMTCIAVTAYHTSRIREEAIRAGFNAYFSKPLDAMHFARELERLL